MKRIWFLCVGILLSTGWIVAETSRAAVVKYNQWDCHGPMGTAQNAQVVCVPAASEGVWAGTQGGGMFLRLPYSSWGVRNAGLDTTYVTSVGAFRNWSAVWAGTIAGLFKSIDWTNWNPVTAVGTDCITAIGTLETVGTYPIRIVWVGNTQGKLFTSSNSGGTWTDVTDTLPAHPITAIAATTADRNTVWVGNSWGMVYKSVPAVGWVKVIDGDNTSRVKCIVLDPTNANKAYVGFEQGEAGGARGVRRTTDGGTHWEWVGLTSRDVLSLYADPLHANTVYAGCAAADGLPVLYRTADGGANWSSRDSGIGRTSGVCSLAMYTDPSVTDWPQGTLFAGLTNGATCQSTNGGASWKWTVAGMDTRAIPGLGTQVQLPNAVYAGDNKGNLFRSADRAWSWAVTGDGTPVIPYNYNQEIRAVAVTPTSGGETPSLWVATGSNNGGFVFHSPDGGATWESEVNEMTSFRCLAYDPLDNSKMYAGGRDVMSTGYSLFRGTDGGQHWYGSVGQHEVRGVVPSPFTAGTVYIGKKYNYSSGQTFFCSTNAGLDWAEPGDDLTGKSVLCLAIHPTHDKVLFAGMEHDGVYWTKDGGGHWAPRGTGLEGLSVTSIAINPLYPQTLYAGTEANGIYRSLNGGYTWASSNGGLWDWIVYTLALHPGAPSRVYASTSSGVFFRSYINDLNFDDLFDTLDIDFGHLVACEANIPVPVDPTAADVNNDGRINAVDMVLMLVNLNAEE
ncbi:MAG: hypothetical protein KA419_11495 [Acidobacteria bacterium]|nr:hypothetical protein [Acidobacteriota bacterium]